MNDFFDPTNEPADDEIASALRTLPTPPEHGGAFWAQLDEQLNAVAPATAPVRLSDHQRRRISGRTQFLLVAAAILAVVGVAGIAINDRATTVDVADVPTTPVPTTVPTPVPTTGSDTEPGPGTSPFVSEIFGYDLTLSDDFTIELADERGVYASHAGGSFGTSLSVSNYFLDDVRSRGALEATDTETLVEAMTVEIPLYLASNGDVTLSENTVVAEQATFNQGDLGLRAVRSFTFSDRTVVIEATIEDSAQLSQQWPEILDSIRLYDQPLQPVTGCSSEGLPAQQAPAELTAAAAARFDGIINALITCDWELLGAQMDVGFMVSFGGDVDAIAAWQEDERYGQPILRAVYDHLAFPVGSDDEGATWPRGWNTGVFDAETEAALLASEYYTEDNLEVWDELTYLGFRTGISDEGTWSYFIAGD